jgi:hypothetical protein
MIKKLLTSFIALLILLSLSGTAFAVIQLNTDLHPSNLPDIEVRQRDPTPGEEGVRVSETIDPDLLESNPEVLATQTIILYVGSLINRVLLFTGTITIIFLIIAGANYILAFGKDERIERGKRGVFWSVIGLLTILFSYAIVQGVITILLRLDVAAT